jgi:phosphohistidine phosphatase
MRVILFRHGPAGQHDPARWPNDDERPLTPRGVERTRAAASGLRRIEPTVSLIWTSPLIRALETARLAEEVLQTKNLETVDALASGASARAVLAAVAKLKADQVVVLVGHEPDLGKLAATMIGVTVPLPLKKAGACGIEFNGPVRAGGGQLLWFLSPRILRRLARKADKL